MWTETKGKNTPISSSSSSETATTVTRTMSKQGRRQQLQFQRQRSTSSSSSSFILGSFIMMIAVGTTKVTAFGIMDPHLIHNVVSTTVGEQSLSSILTTSSSSSVLEPIITSTTSTVVASSASTASTATHQLQDWYESYRQILYTYPIRTKMITGATIAVLADGIAQASAAIMAATSTSSSTTDKKDNAASTQTTNPASTIITMDWYNSKRAISFATFDAVYRVVQHELYPPMVQEFHGQYITKLGSIITRSTTDLTLSWSGPLEQALISQLVIIPLVYYPVFFAVTGMVQGLSVEETLDRAKSTFLPIMTRNLIYWIPCQFSVFLLVEEQLQIPILTGLGLIWTIILSIYAGSAAVAGTAGTSSSTTTVPAVSTVSLNNINSEEEEIDISGIQPGLLLDADRLGMATSSSSSSSAAATAAASMVEMNGQDIQEVEEVQEEQLSTNGGNSTSIGY